MRDERRSSRIAAFCIGLAGIVFQLTLTRLSSAALDYHLTFLAISAAMLGLSAGGTWVAGWVPVEDSEAATRRLALRLCLGGALTQSGVLAAFAWAALRTLGEGGVLAAIAVGFLLCCAPYVCAGAAMALLLRGDPARRPGTYTADLAGAAAGCAFGLAAMQALGPPWAALLACLAWVGAAMAIASPSGVTATVSLVTLLVAASAAASAFRPNMLPTKPLAVFLDTVRYPDAKVETTYWDAVARVDAFDAPGAPLLWQPSVGRLDLPELRGITIDGDALTAAVRLDESGHLTAANLLPASLPYAIAERRRVLVIGPGGGVDVAAALGYGAREIEAVEVNPAIVRLMLGPLRDLSGDLYHRPGVRLVRDEGRSYLRRSAQRYDAIVLTAVDSWAALAAGAYSLSESYLYTREAVGDFYDHLADGGVLAISRWFSRPPREMERLAALSRAALEARGQPAQQAVLVQRAGDFGTLLVRRGRFTAAEVANARSFATGNAFSLAYDPLEPRGEIAAIFQEDAPDRRTLPSDDRPFFFDFLPWSQVMEGSAAPGNLPRGHAVLLLSLVECACLAMASVILPRRRLRTSLNPGEQARWGAYCLVVGIGFMGVEAVLIQRSTLQVGVPALAQGVTLLALLGGAAAGSSLTGRARFAGPVVLVGLAALLAVYMLVLPAAITAGLGWSTPARVGVVVGLALPPAVLMGAALPLALAALPDGAAVAWAWGVNGAASALGIVLATIAAMEWGYMAVLGWSAALYLAGALLLWRRLGRGAAMPAQMR